MTPLLLAVLLAQTPPPPAPAGGAPASIRGQVVDKETGQPLPRALVTVRVFGGRSEQAWQHVADGEGRFEFVNLPRAAAELTATAGERRATYQPYSTRLKLAEGGNHTDLIIPLVRTYAISGRLVDHEGFPLAGMSVRARPARAVEPWAGSMSVSSDDRGMFRIFGLAPGRYVVCAAPSFAPRAQHTVTTARPERFAKTCHPAAPTEEEGQIVTVERFDVDGLEIRVRRSLVYTISGTILEARGEPAVGASVGLTAVEQGRPSGGFRTAVTGGQFVYSGIVPGEYLLHADVQGDDGRPQQRAATRIRIDDADLDGVVLALRPPATITGRVTFEDGAPDARAMQRMTVVSRVNPEDAVGGSTVRPSPLGGDRTFTLSGLFGRHRLGVQSIPPGYVVKTIRYRGEDITDLPTEFATDPKQEVEIVLSSRGAIVTGAVVDESLEPAVGASVLLLPADPRRRQRDTYSLPSALTDKQGRFRLPPVRAGEYLLVALAAGQQERLSSRADLADALAKLAEAVSLVENDRLTMNLRVTTVPDR